LAIVVIWIASGGCSGSDPCSSRGCNGGKDCTTVETSICENLFCRNQFSAGDVCSVAIQSACTNDFSLFGNSTCALEISPCDPSFSISSMADCVDDAGLSLGCSATLVEQAQIAFADGG